jgi:hypothetical protein
MTSNYSVENITSFLSKEKIAIHGVSPAVYEQNRILVSRLAEVAHASSDSLLSVQIIGSRSNGTSNLESDLDLVAVTFDDEGAQSDVANLVDAAEAMGIETDSGLAAVATGAHDQIPIDPSEFIYWTDADSGQTASLFEKGIYSTPSQRLAQLAVTSILKSNISEGMAQAGWEDIRDAHAQIYLGDFARMEDKLVSRLGTDNEAAIRSALSRNLKNQRIIKFGLPIDFNKQHNANKRWAEKSKLEINSLPAWDLYNEVLEEVS